MLHKFLKMDPGIKTITLDRKVSHMLALKWLKNFYAKQLSAYFENMNKNFNVTSTKLSLRNNAFY